MIKKSPSAFQTPKERPEATVYLAIGDMMHLNNFPITLATSLAGLARVNAAVPHIGTLGAVTILSDNDLAGQLHALASLTI